MSTALAEHVAPSVTNDEMDLIRRTVANGATDPELKLFLFDCQRRGIHPLDKLLHFTKRGGKYTPVTSIDFMRSQAAMTGEMAGSEDPIFQIEDVKTHPLAATVTVYRMTQGQRFPYSATARWSEYCPDNAPMWKRMPHTMLGKCAEALALRKAFPQQLAGLYTSDEMDQAGAPAPQAPMGAALPEAPRSFQPSVPNGGDSGAIIDMKTGEELPPAPAGFEDWWTDMIAAADNGIEALEEGWRSTTKAMRVYADKAKAAQWKAMKEKAAKLAPKEVAQ